MSRRTVASLLAVAVLVGLVGLASRLPVPYVTVSPGPTIDVLGKTDGEPIVQVSGRRTYPTSGELRLTTVSVTSPDSRVSLGAALGGWLQPDVDVLPFESMYPSDRTAEQERAESAAQMVSSQDAAIAAALTELGYRLRTYAEVTGVTSGGPSEGKLEPRDRVLRADGHRVRAVEDLLAVVDETTPGDRIDLRVRRDGRPLRVTITTVAAQDDPDQALIGVLVGTGYAFPFDVTIALDDSIGGPSAGLVFSLSVYDTLTPGSLVDATVAGTGTISPDGVVGPIGGIHQKIAAARDVGASLFLVPPGNCEGAVDAAVGGVRLVRADTLHAAVEALESYAENPDATLPRCPS